ncbi:hypothetical protein SAMN05421504_101270 [Amycolatopsis xylanica]|uniref:Uncharacterized protein n=1 Tax=Amycolatopsis xylanica TaxID=589385 RepID=A0A1H2SLZ7_9PSEU|nr:hypothetical protein [Amycolatopsis xylanica]SDW32646.1 hypothetical protein SAMN05421504_101270 [Amycolatopsis xylanica]
MSILYREPELDYDEMVEHVTLNYRVEELPALQATAGKPGERLWFIEDIGTVYVIRRENDKSSGFWQLEHQHPLDTVRWLTGRLEYTILTRLRRPHRSREYALDPELAERDLAVLDELERVWLSGTGPAQIPSLNIRIQEIEADLAQAKAMRARHLLTEFGDDPARVATELGVDHDTARDMLTVRDRYHAWIRRGTVKSREAFPVHTPTGATGLPDRLATRLMTAACGDEDVVPGKTYPRPLPAELAPWYVYIGTVGHCVAVAIDGIYQQDGDPWDYMAVVPVKTVLRAGWTMTDGVVVSPVPYEEFLGCAALDEDDTEL